MTGPGKILTKLADDDRRRFLLDLPRLFLRSADVAKVMTLLTEPALLEAKLRDGYGFDLAKNLQSAFRVFSRIGPDVVDDFLRALVEILFRNEQKRAAFQIGALQNLLDGDTDRTFQLTLLRAGMQSENLPKRGAVTATRTAFVRKCRTHYAALCRRAGDLAASSKLLEQVELEMRDQGQLNELAFFEYEHAYVFFLAGRLERAIELFGQSAMHARRAGDRLGEWIGRCMEYRTRRCRWPREAHAFLPILDRAERVFQELAASNERGTREYTLAFRWLLNVKKDRCEAAFASGDRDRLVKASEELHADAWLASVDGGDRYREVMLHQNRARLHMLEQRWVAAVREFATYLRFPPAAHKRPELVSWCEDREEIVWDYLECGLALARCGRTQSARTVWTHGIRLSRERGNHVWQQRIRAKLAGLDRKNLQRSVK